MTYDFVTPRSAPALVRDLKRKKSLGFDTETFGEEPVSFDWVRGEQAWHQWSDGKQAWLVDTQAVDVKLFKPILEDEGIEKIIHNSAFDCSWTAREHGMFTRNICDTRYREQIILGIALPRDLTKAQKEYFDPLYSASLKYCLKRRNLPSKFEFEPFIKGKKVTASQITYMVRDVDHLHILRDMQQEEIDKKELGNVDYLESQIAEITYQMMCNGFAVDTTGWLRYTAQEEKAYEAALSKLKKIADINWNSWAQYYKFFNVDNTDILYTNKYKGTPTQMKALSLWRESKEHTKAVTTYGREFLAQHVHNGQIHCNYTQMVNTARFACERPNLQNLLPEVTQFFKPAHGPNNVFCSADFSGQEMAIMAYGSGEKKWLECLRAGRDVHYMVAGDVLGEAFIKADQVTKDRLRKQIKIINFSIAYGAGVETIAERAGTDELTIRKRLARMKQLYPALFRWLESNGAEAKRTWESYSFLPFKRYRSLAMELQGWRRVNIGKNNPVQMSAADMTKMAMYYFYQEIKAGLKAWMIHQLHDELIVECHRRDAKKVAKVLVDCMNRACIDILEEALSFPEVKIKGSWDKRKAA